MVARRVAPIIGLQPDWVVVALPTALAVQVRNYWGSCVVLALMAITVLFRKPGGRFSVGLGPLLFLIAACAIVYSRPESYRVPLILLLYGILVLRLVMTVDARRLIASLIDGVGLYLVVNILCKAAGISSPDEQRMQTEAARTFFPLTNGLNTPSIVAGMYLIASIYLVREVGWIRRSLRLICSAGAVFVIVGIASRTALAVTVALAVVAVIFPSISRWSAQIATLTAVASAFVLPNVLGNFEFAITPLTGLASGRDSSQEGVVSLNGRRIIWENSITYWNEQITDLSDKLLGFGESGQSRSGVSVTYYSIVKGLGQHPELATVHNSFLQQLFDGGIVGWLFLAIGTYWASARLSFCRHQWGHWGLSAIFAMTAMLLGSTTEAAMAPGVNAESFWLLVFLVGIACQARADPGSMRDSCRQVPEPGIHSSLGPI